MDSGYMKQIRERILSAEDGTIFATSDFADVADSATVLDGIKSLGFKYSTRGAITVSIADMTVPAEKKTLIARMETSSTT